MVSWNRGLFLPAWCLILLLLESQFVVGISLATREVASSSEFFTALQEQDVDVLVVTGDISLSSADFDSPLLINRGVLIHSQEETDDSFFRLDFNFLQTRATIAPGVVIEFRHLNLQNTRFGPSYNIDFFGYSPNGTIFLIDSIGEQPSCAPFNLDRIKGLLPPEGFPPDFEQDVEVVPHLCLGGSCWDSLLRYNNYGIISQTGSVDGHWNEGGYFILIQNSVKACQTFVSRECISRTSVDACVVNAINTYISNRSASHVLVGNKNSYIEESCDAPTYLGWVVRGITHFGCAVLLVSAAFVGVHSAQWSRSHIQDKSFSSLVKHLALCFHELLRSKTIAELEMAEKLAILFKKTSRHEAQADESDNSDVITWRDGAPSRSHAGPPQSLSTSACRDLMVVKACTSGPVSLLGNGKAKNKRGLGIINPHDYCSIRSVIPAPDSSGGSDPLGNLSAFVDPAQQLAKKKDPNRSNQPCMQRIHGYDDSGNKFFIEVSSTLLGSGCFGKVWKGAWGGQDVAVKQMEHSSAIADMVANEVAIMLKFKHQNVVCALQYVNFTLVARYKRAVTFMGKRKAPALKMPPCKSSSCSSNTLSSQSLSTSESRGINSSTATGNSGNSSNTSKATSGGTSYEGTSNSADQDFHVKTPEEESSCSTWLVLELCDKGTLSSSIKQGMFHDDGVPQMRALLARLMDVAAGCAYVHSQGICHGDLKNSNILLSSCETDPFGVVAKVADFGLSRALAEDQTHLSTRTMGTVSHTAPELLRSGKLSPAADVYAFGICVHLTNHHANYISPVLASWELFNGRTAYRGMMHGRIVERVVVERLRPKWPAWVPLNYRSVVEECWAHEASDRPSFNTVTRLLSSLVACVDELQAQLRLLAGRPVTSGKDKLDLISKVDLPRDKLDLVSKVDLPRDKIDLVTKVYLPRDGLDLVAKVDLPRDKLNLDLVTKADFSRNELDLLTKAWLNQ
eukprot:gene18287-24745_t